MVDIVIVNWNSGSYLKKCIDSLLVENNVKYIQTIFIIDNNSADYSMENISSHAKIKTIKNEENKGFSKACNQGFKLCNASYILLLNPDAKAHETTLADCISFMDAREEVDILGCRLTDDNGNTTYSCARFPTPLRFFYDMTGLSKIAPKIFMPALLMTDWDHKECRFVDQVMGAFMFMRSSIFKQTGYFDERYFVYYEELDFSKRLAGQGGKSFYNPNISATHSGEGTTHSIKALRLFFNLNSRLQYCKKHFTRPGYFFVWFCTFFIEPITRILFSLSKSGFKEIKEIVKGYKLLIVERRKSVSK
jgi:N-acetylglucosaminyl-diphospho-decaprenol L-rhamnosyltransferase